MGAAAEVLFELWDKDLIGANDRLGYVHVPLPPLIETLERTDMAVISDWLDVEDGGGTVRGGGIRGWLFGGRGCGLCSW